MLIFCAIIETNFETMPPTTCMLCQKTGKMYYYNVYTDYDNISHTIRDDLVEIFGVDVEQYLSPSYFVCGVCMAILKNLANLKRRLWPLICQAQENCKPIKLGKIWDIFASLKFEDESEEEDHHSISCRTPTPSKLLTLNYSKAYNHNLEKQIAVIERKRSLSRASSGFGRSDARSDVSEASEATTTTTRKRRRRKNGHKNWTRHKQRTKSPATSEFSARSYTRHSRLSDFERSYSPLSDCSYRSCYTLRKTPVKREVEYDDQGRLVRKRTRSVSRAQEEEARQLEIVDSSKFYCGEADCPLYFEDVDVLNHHRIMHHNMLALHYCDECQQKYTTLKHLKLHKKSHDVFPFMCSLCLCNVKNQEALQEHLEEHMTYSVPCKYCDKSFLNKKSCEMHFKFAHSRRREHIVHKRKIIIDRLDKDQKDSVSSVNDSSAQSSSNKNLVVYFLPYTDMECNKEDLDVTADNFKTKGMEFIVDENVDSELDKSKSLLETPPKHSIENGVLPTSSTDEGDV